MHSEIPYELWVKDAGEKLVMLTNINCYESFKEVEEQYEYIEPFSNFSDNGNIERRAIELHQMYHFHTIVAVNEYDIIRSSLLRKHLGIKGQLPESAEAFRNKIVMKEMLSKGGIDVSPFRVVNSNIDLLNYATEHPFPFVLKLVDGSAAEGVTVINNEHDLVKRLEVGVKRGNMVEAFIPGEIYHIDGLIDHGDILFSWPSLYINDCLAYKAGKPSGSYVLDRNNPLWHRLNEMVSKAIHVLPTPELTAFHAEIFHTPDDQLVFCEIASRVGGSKIGSMLYKAFEFDLLKTWIKLQCGKVSFDGRLIEQNCFAGNVLVHPKKGTFIKAPLVELPEWVVEYDVLASPGESFDYGNHCNDCLASFVVIGESESDIRLKLDSAVEWFETKMMWDDDLVFHF